MASSGGDTKTSGGDSADNGQGLTMSMLRLPSASEVQAAKRRRRERPSAPELFAESSAFGLIGRQRDAMQVETPLQGGPRMDHDGPFDENHLYCPDDEAEVMGEGPFDSDAQSELVEQQHDGPSKDSDAQSELVEQQHDGPSKPDHESSFDYNIRRFDVVVLPKEHRSLEYYIALYAFREANPDATAQEANDAAEAAATKSGADLARPSPPETNDPLDGRGAEYAPEGVVTTATHAGSDDLAAFSIDSELRVVEWTDRASAIFNTTADARLGRLVDGALQPEERVVLRQLFLLYSYIPLIDGDDGNESDALSEPCTIKINQVEQELVPELTFRPAADHATVASTRSVRILRFKLTQSAADASSVGFTMHKWNPCVAPQECLTSVQPTMPEDDEAAVRELEDVAQQSLFQLDLNGHVHGWAKLMTIVTGIDLSHTEQQNQHTSITQLLADQPDHTGAWWDKALDQLLKRHGENDASKFITRTWAFAGCRVRCLLRIKLELDATFLRVNVNLSDPLDFVELEERRLRATRELQHFSAGSTETRDPVRAGRQRQALLSAMIGHPHDATPLNDGLVSHYFYDESATMPPIGSTIGVRQWSGHEEDFKTDRILLFDSRPGGDIVVGAFSCGAGKSTGKARMYKEQMAKSKRMGRSIIICEISCRRAQAGDIGKELADLNCVVYLDKETGEATGAVRRLKGADCIVLSLQTARAFGRNKEFMQRFDDKNTDIFIMFDEVDFIARILQPEDPMKQSCFPDPDASFQVIKRMCKHARVYGLGADSVAGRNTANLFARICPGRPVNMVHATKVALQDVEVEYAFFYPDLTKPKCEMPSADPSAAVDSEVMIAEGKFDVNPHRAAWNRKLHLALSHAVKRYLDARDAAQSDPSIDPGDERVFIWVATAADSEWIKAKVKDWGLWSDQHCRIYSAKSTTAEREDLKDTNKAWRDDNVVYLVICTPSITVAHTFEVPFGAAFETTCPSNAGLIVEGKQGCARIWRFPAVFPRADGWNKGRRVIYALLKCPPPDKVYDQSVPEFLDEYTEREFERLIKANASSVGVYAEQVRASHESWTRTRNRGGDESASTIVRSTDHGTLRIAAANAAERKLQQIRHFDAFKYYCELETRQFKLSLIKPYTGEDEEEAPNVLAPVDGDGAEEGGGDEEEDNDAEDELVERIRAWDAHLAGGLSHVKLEWLVNEFRVYCMSQRVPQMTAAQFEMEFFEHEGCPFDIAAVRMRNGTPACNGTTTGVLKELYEVQKPIRRIFTADGCDTQPAKTDAIKYMSAHGVAVGYRATLMACSLDDVRSNIRPRGRFGLQQPLLDIEMQLSGLLSMVGLSVADFLPQGAARREDERSLYGGQGFDTRVQDFGVGVLIPFDSQTVDLDFKYDPTPPSEQRVTGRFAALVDAHEYNRPVEEGKNGAPPIYSAHLSTTQTDLLRGLKGMASTVFKDSIKNARKDPLLPILSKILHEFLAIKLVPTERKIEWRVDPTKRRPTVTSLAVVFNAKTAAALYTLYDCNSKVYAPAAYFRNASLLPPTITLPVDTGNQDGGPSHAIEESVRPAAHNEYSAHIDVSAAKELVQRYSVAPYRLHADHDLSKAASAKLTQATSTEDHEKIALARDWQVIVATSQLSEGAVWREVASRPHAELGVHDLRATHRPELSLSKCTPHTRDRLLAKYEAIDVAVPSDRWGEDAPLWFAVGLLVQQYPDQLATLRSIADDDFAADDARNLALLAIGVDTDGRIRGALNAAARTPRHPGAARIDKCVSELGDLQFAVLGLPSSAPRPASLLILAAKQYVQQRKRANHHQQAASRDRRAVQEAWRQLSDGRLAACAIKLRLHFESSGLDVGFVTVDPTLGADPSTTSEDAEPYTTSVITLYVRVPDGCGDSEAGGSSDAIDLAIDSAPIPVTRRRINRRAAKLRIQRAIREYVERRGESQEPQIPTPMEDDGGEAEDDDAEGTERAGGDLVEGVPPELLTEDQLKRGIEEIVLRTPDLNTVTPKQIREQLEAKLLPSHEPGQLRPYKRAVNALIKPIYERVARERNRDDACTICNQCGFLVECEVCRRDYHLQCAGLLWPPEGDFICTACSGAAPPALDAVGPLFACDLCAEEKPVAAQARCIGWDDTPCKCTGSVCSHCLFKETALNSKCPSCRAPCKQLRQCTTGLTQDLIGRERNANQMAMADAMEEAGAFD